LRNQAHPRNLVAVGREKDTPAIANPSEKPKYFSLPRQKMSLKSWTRNRIGYTVRISGNFPRDGSGRRVWRGLRRPRPTPAETETRSAPANTHDTGAFRGRIEQVASFRKWGAPLGKNGKNRHGAESRWTMRTVTGSDAKLDRKVLLDREYATSSDFERVVASW